MLGGVKCLQTGLSQALPARRGRFGSASTHTKTRIDCSTAAMDGRLPGPRQRSILPGAFGRPHISGGKGSQRMATWSAFHQSRLVRPQIYDTHPQPQTSRYRPDTVSRESDVTLPGWGGEPWMETGDTVHSGRQPPGRVSAVTSDHIVMM